VKKIFFGFFVYLLVLVALNSEAGIFFMHRLLGKKILTVTVVPVYATNGANWNDYVKRTNNTGSDHDNNQPDTACAGNETGWYEACIHGGEKKKATLTGYTSCSNIAATDDLGAFDWECQLVGGVATVFTKRLKPTKRLADLVNATSWKSNFVTVTQSGGLIAKSNAATWWTNTVQAPTANTGVGDAPVALSTASTIYVVPSSTTTSGYQIAASKIGFVVLPGATLSYSGRTTANTNFWGGCGAATTHFAVLFGGTQNYLWVEGRFNGNFPGTPSGAGALGICTTRFSMYRNINALGTPNGGNVSGLVFFSGVSNFFKDIVVESYGGNWSGIYLDSTNTYTRWNNVVVNGNNSGVSDHALNIGGSNHRFNQFSVLGHRAGNSFVRAIQTSSLTETIMTNTWVAGANETGLIFGTSSRNTVHQFTSANNRIGGFVAQDTNYTTFNSVVAVNNGDATVGGYGMFFQNSDFTKISQAVFANNAATSVTGINADANSNSAILQNYMLYGNNTQDCRADNGTAGFTSACANQGSSTATWRTGKTLANSFVGKVTSNDTANASDSSGSQSFASITDWFNFDNRYRGWGRDGSAFPNADNRNACSSGTCRIWDWRVRSTDTVIRNTSNDGSTQNGAFVANSACPAAVGGSYTIVDQLTTANTFLVNAIEVIGDYTNGKMVGDDDGLCESNEACIYSPNYGAYQGEGDYISNGTCTFSGGTVTGVTMYAYPTNGG
jgi:hypothetical protein